MPRTTPSGIAALKGVVATRAPIMLMEWQLSTPVYLSSAEQVTWNGHTWEKNRVISVTTFEAAYIDRKSNDSQKIQIRLDNLADNGGSSFPFTALNAGQSFEDKVIKIYLYSPDAADAVLTWFGYTQGTKFSGGDKYCDVEGGFFWDSLDLQEPPLLLQAKGFQQQEAAAKTGENQDEALPVPLIYGAGPLRVWPPMYNHWITGENFHCTYVLSGVQAGQAFASTDVQAASMQLFGVTNATTVEFYPGNQSSAPTNLTRFPENNAHLLCAFGYAVFPVAGIRDRLDNVTPQDLRLVVQNGRPLVDTSLPSENAPLILRDIMRDPVFGTGLGSSLFDSTVLTSTANYVGTRYQVRYELSKQLSFSETVQRILSDFHGFITFDDGLIQIRCKKNTESSVATFATIDSGQAGRKIHNDFVDVTIKDSSELINQVTLKYRRKTKNRRIVTLYDPNAQTRAGGTAKKVVELVIDESDSGGLYDETQAQINCAIIVREEQNGNLFISFQVPIWDGIDVSPGDVITVFSPDIINNGGNNSFRVTKQSIDHAACLISFECQVYKTAIYNDDASALGVDLLRGGEDTNAQGRPPDVIPVSLTVIDVVANDTEGKDATLRATFTVPLHDPTADTTAGIFREPPIAEVEINWHYTDEPVQASRFGGSLKIVQQATAFQASIDFVVPYFKSRSVEAFFVSIGANRARVPLGLIPDPTKVTTIAGGNLSATAATVGVAATGSNFNPNDYVQIEKEQLKVQAKGTNFIDFVNVAGVRTPQFGTVSIGHPSGTEIAVLKQSYPSLIRSLLQARFTYPTVVEKDALQRGGDGIRVRWTDVSPDNLEQYTVAWSKDADAGTNVAKLGSATPAWYLADPLTPPAGVTLSPATGQKALLIPQEDIGPIGTVIFARIYARNGKRNFSAALSGLLNSSVAAGGNQPPTDAPTAPNAVYLVGNVPEMTPEGLKARCTFQVNANSTGTKTFAQTGATSVVIVFTLPSGGKLRPEFFIDDPSQVFINCVQYFTLGDTITWQKNVAWNAGGSLASATNPTTFFAGGSSPNLAGITGFAITSVTGSNETISTIAWGFTQPSTPVLVSHALILAQYPGEATFVKSKKTALLNDPNNQTPGAKTFTDRVEHPKKSAVQYKIRLVSVDGSILESPIFNATSPDVDTGPPNNGTVITITRAVIKHGRTLIVEPVIPTVQMVSFWKTTLIIHDNGATGTRQYYDPATAIWGTTLVEITDLLTIPISKAELLAAGRTAVFCKVGIWNRFNSGSVTYSADVPAVGAGQILATGSGTEPATGDTGVPSGLLAPDVQDNYGTLEVSCFKPSTNAATIKRYQVVLSLQSTPPAGNPTQFLEGVQRIKEGQAIPFRNKQGATTTIWFFFRAENDFGFSAWSPGTSVTGTTIGRPADDVIGTDVPALTMALERSQNSSAGHSLTTFVIDTSAVTTTDYYKNMVLYGPSLSAGDAVRNITASVLNSGLIIVTIDTPFSSVPSNFIPFQIHRGLVLAGKSGSGHTTTTFVLPAAASNVDSFYNGMMLYIPSAAVGQQLQRIISYVGSTRTATIEGVEAALASSPAANCGFMLSQGSFGYASNNGTGIIAPVQLRLWYNVDSTRNVGEVIPSSGENSYSLTTFEFEMIRRSNGVKRAGEKIAITATPGFDFATIASVPMVRIRFRNSYRGTVSSPSDGWGSWSYYVPGFQTAPTTVYLPGTYIPVEIDPQALANKPTSRYSVY